MSGKHHEPEAPEQLRPENVIVDVHFGFVYRLSGETLHVIPRHRRIPR